MRERIFSVCGQVAENGSEVILELETRSSVVSARQYVSHWNKANEGKGRVSCHVRDLNVHLYRKNK